MRKLTALLASAALFAVATPAVVEAQEKDIVETASAAGTFITFGMALEMTGLAETLKSEGPYTVFAPSDSAFATLPADQLDALLNNKGALRELLLAHVINRRVSSADVRQLDGKTAETAAGSNARITISDGTVKINESTVVQADIEASNGVIHEIDSVILPALP